MILGVEQKKGNPDLLDGRVIVYALIDIEPSDLLTMKHPIASMIHAGMLVATGNFKDQNNLRDFLKSEMGVSLEDGLGEGLAQLIDKMEGIESALDPDKLKERLENMEELEEFIPTPAKIVPFHSEQEVLDQDGDVYFVGLFKNIGNAVLSINALPILYQARYREQGIQRVRNEIEMLISQIEHNSVAVKEVPKISNTEIEQKLLKEFIPSMLYSRNQGAIFDAAKEQFRLYMKEYKQHDDVEFIIKLIGGDRELEKKEFRLLELYAKKVAAVINNDTEALTKILHEISALDEQ